MSNYRRLISYIYAYEGGIKGKNIGFAKIETRGIQCKITVSVKRIYVGGNDIGVYLLAGDREVLLGNIFIRNGSGEFRSVVSVSNIENSGITMEQCYGLTIHDVKNTWRSYTTIWEDAVAHAAEVELENATSNSKKTAGSLATEEQIKKAVREIEEEFPLTPQKPKEKRQENREQPERETMQVEGVHTGVIMPRPEKKEKTSTKIRPEEPMSEVKMAVEKEPLPEVKMTVVKEPMPDLRMAVEKEPLPEVKMVVEKDSETVGKLAVEEESKTVQQEIEKEVIREKGSIYCEPYGPYNVHATMDYPNNDKKETDFMPQLENPDTLEQLSQSETCQDDSHDLVWEKFKREHTRILAFDYENGCEILTIKPQDIGLLPRDVWVFGNNSFLLHGYYNYRYLILAKLLNPDGMPRYLLGVPGHYYSNERYMASMFGFPHFVLSKEQPRGDDRFGYWYTDIQLGG